MLDLFVQDFLENNLSSEEFTKLKERNFQDRIQRIKKFIAKSEYATEKRQALEKFLIELEPIRELRNHIAHGVMRIGLAQDQKTQVLTLSLPKDLDGTNSPTARHLEYAELEKSLNVQTGLIEGFRQISQSK
jgi:hypothetical protein